MLFDGSVVETISGAVPTSVAIAFLFVSFLGSVYVVVPSVALAVFRGDSDAPTRTWPGIVIGGYGLFVALKPLFSIDRPAVDLPIAPEMLPVLLVPLYDLGVGFTSASFPSGHAIAATVFWGLVALDLTVGSRRTRLAISATVIALVCLSRVVLGVHFPADVLAGVALGLGYLAVAITIRRWVANPATTMLAVGGFIAFGGVLSGRWTDAAVLLAAATATRLVYRYRNDSRLAMLALRG